jgi:hypothetical protein
MSSSRGRRRLSRTFSRSRWPEYHRLLKAALSAGYEIVPLRRYVDGRLESPERPVLILRHDIDQHPASALEMSDIETKYGVRSTWYFRWRTAHPAVIAEIRRRRGEVGLHYETLTRELLQDPLPPDGDIALRLPAAREKLRAEIAEFERLFGPIRSISAHGDTRVPGVDNGDLLREQHWSDFGITYEANRVLSRKPVAAWITDRSAAAGGWGDGVDPFERLRARQSPILLLTHSNNWVSGASLWKDRLLSGVLPSPKPGVESRIVRTTADAPPIS